MSPAEVTELVTVAAAQAATGRPFMLPPPEIVRAAAKAGQCMNCLEAEGGKLRTKSAARKLHRKATKLRPRCPEHWREWDRHEKLRQRAKRAADGYGLTPEQRAALIELQGGVCPITGQGLDLEIRANGGPRLRKSATDHDHACCAGPPTCGRCTRGITTGWVNRDLIGRLEQMEGGGLAAAQRLVAYFTESPYQQLRRLRPELFPAEDEPAGAEAGEPDMERSA